MLCNSRRIMQHTTGLSRSTVNNTLQRRTNKRCLFATTAKNQYWDDGNSINHNCILVDHRSHHHRHHHHHRVAFVATRQTTQRSYFSTQQQKQQQLSPRQAAELEDHLLTKLGNEMVEPNLQTTLKDLGWIKSVHVMASSSSYRHHSSLSTRQESNRPTAADDDAIKLQVTLRLPTPLIPSLEELKEKLANQVRQECQTFLKNARNHHDVGNNNDKNSDNVVVQVKASASKPFPFVRNAQEQEDVIKNLGPGLAHVTHFLAVYSCKGGVGKSTIAVNLAYELARMGGRVGLLDVDIYGPSLPVLIHPTDPTVRRSSLGSGMVMPIEHGGVKLMSLGFVSSNSGVPGSGSDGGAAVMRGHMATRVVTQLLKGTEWGDLDVLVLDLPPGTGDVQLAVCQDLQLSGAVAVSTPSKLAAADTSKGIEMFTSLGVPTLATVENMAYFECEGGGKHYPFGKGTLQKEGAAAGHVFQLPVSSITNDANDSGSPLCLTRPSGAATEGEGGGGELAVFEDLAQALAKDLLLLQHGRSIAVSGSDDETGAPTATMVSFPGSGSREVFDVASLHLSMDPTKEHFVVRLFSESGASQVSLDAQELRSRNPKNGDKLDLGETSDDNSPQDDEKPEVPLGHNDMVQHFKHSDRYGSGDSNDSSRLLPAKIQKKGRYGYSVEWADGATIIYSMVSIAKAAGGVMR